MKSNKIVSIFCSESLENKQTKKKQSICEAENQELKRGGWKQEKEKKNKKQR